MSKDLKGLGGLYNGSASSFAWHPVLMVWGMVICYAEAMLSYRAFPLGKATNKIIHLVLQTLATFFICMGLYAVFKNHNDGLVANLYSLHSWLGIATVVLFFHQWVLGFAAFWLGAASPETKKAYLPVHVYLGVLTFFSAIITVESGITEKLAWLGCGYKVTEPDYNPASHYDLIPAGCKVANWLGMCILVLAGCAGVAVMDLGVGAASKTRDQERLAANEDEKETLLHKA
eukprot:CAMPEP_0113942982 /NCGR_PEP_ID=MMETSP1339-20121228/14993_1 /TAXON_ID=94617 /ORGANISM="Fibrocapsa japonica" /LENGTH=230 /DNA_ID=CAMNT_0000947697 /DNA_START=250 /DNA_END=942 /DNA_ORIENTATION=+ /assembly_acc=CAM_ASM_000762